MRTTDLLTAAEVAEVCRVNRSTVSRWAKAGALPAVRLPGGMLRFRPDDVDDFLSRPGGDAA